MLSLARTTPEPDAFHSVLQARSGRWYNACLRITRDADLAADAVQDALLKAWHRRDEFRGEAALDSWIHRIALNAAIDLTRKRKRRAEDEFEPEVHEVPTAETPESDYAHESLTRDLAVAMQRLSQSEQQTFVLKHIEGWKLEEIAESTRTNINNVKSTLFRAVHKLRVDLKVWRSATE